MSFTWLAFARACSLFVLGLGFAGCRPRFGPDGFLWVGTGDAAIGTNPQDDGSLGGKVLRIDRDGVGAPGNPSGLRWYSKGHRNVQGMAFRSDGLGMSAERGPSVDDEVNLLVPGNFGWDPVPGYNESVPMTDIDKFPDAIEAAWSSGSPKVTAEERVIGNEGRLRSPRLGPDGLLYITTDGGDGKGKVLRVTPVPEPDAVGGTIDDR
ncbi:MAG: PQQ-dependent sugar dehydrogenase [Myxococcales bacterium]|nr:PQQ-dependent sugar dehydrogenase [Myxococcales bacterium]